MNDHCELATCGTELGQKNNNRIQWLTGIGLAFKEKKVDYFNELKVIGRPEYGRIDGSPVSLGMPRLNHYSSQICDFKVFETIVNDKAKNYLKRIKHHFRDLHRLLTFEYRQLRNLQVNQIYDETNDDLMLIKVPKKAINQTNQNVVVVRSNLSESEVIFGCAKSRYLVLKAYTDALKKGVVMLKLPTVEVELMNRWRPDFTIEKLFDRENKENKKEDDNKKLNLVFKPTYLPSLIQSEEGVDLNFALKLDSFFQDALLELSNWENLNDLGKRKLVGAFFAMSTITLSKKILLLMANFEPETISYLHGLILYEEPEFNKLTGSEKIDENTFIGGSSKMLVPSKNGLYPIYADLIKITQLLTEHTEKRLQSKNLNAVNSILENWNELASHSFKYLIAELKSKFDYLVNIIDSIQEEQVNPTGISPIKSDQIKDWVASLEAVTSWANEKLEPEAELIVLNALNKQQVELVDIMNCILKPVAKAHTINNTINSMSNKKSLKEKIVVMNEAEKLFNEAESKIQVFNGEIEARFLVKPPLVEQLSALPDIKNHFKPDAPVVNVQNEINSKKAELDKDELEFIYELAIEQAETQTKTIQLEADNLKRENLNLRQHNEQLLNRFQKNNVEPPKWEVAKIAFDALVEQGASAKTIISTCQAMFQDRIFFFSQVIDSLDKIDRSNMALGVLANRLFVLATEGVDLMRENGGQIITLRNIVAPGISCQESEGVRTNSALISKRVFTRTPGETCEVLPHFAIGDLHRMYLRFHEERIEIAYLGKHLSTSSFNI